MFDLVDSAKMSTEMPIPFKNVFIKNFGQSLDDHTLKSLFGKFGYISSAKVMNDPEGISKGYGFVCFKHYTSASKAIEEMNGKFLNGKPLFVGRAKSKEERNEEMQKHMTMSGFINPKANLYIKELDPRVDENFLVKFFSAYGIVTSAKVMRHPNGKSRGFGFVSFTRAEDAHEAIKYLNGRRIFAKPLYVSIAQRKIDRNAQLAAERKARIETQRNEDIKSVEDLLDNKLVNFNAETLADLFAALGNNIFYI